MASGLNPSAKGASSSDLLAEISAVLGAQDEDAFCNELGRCNLGSQERVVDMRDWVAVVDRINAVLAEAQKAVPNVLDDDPARLVEIDHKAATRVKICLAFCVGLLTNAQHKRLFWDFTHVKCLLGAADPEIVQLTLEVLFAYSIPLSETMASVTEERHDDIEVETEIAESCAQLLEGLRLFDSSSRISTYLGKLQEAPTAKTAPMELRIELGASDSRPASQITLTSELCQRDVRDVMKSLVQEHEIPLHHRLSVCCAVRALAATSWLERCVVGHMQLLCLSVLIHSKLPSDHLVQLLGRDAEFVKDIILLANPTEAATVCDVPLFMSTLAMECLVALVTTRREVLTGIVVEKQLGLVEGSQEGLLRASIVHGAVLASGGLPTPSPSHVAAAERMHALSLEGLTGVTAFDERRMVDTWKREAVRYVGVSFDLLSAAIHSRPGQSGDQAWLAEIEGSVVPLVVEIARACLPETGKPEPGPRLWTLAHALRMLETMLYKNARQQFEQVGGVELLTDIMQRFQDVATDAALMRSPSTHCVVENVLGALMALMASSNRWITVNDAATGVQQMYQPTFNALARSIFERPTAFGEQVWTLLIQLLRAAIEVDPALVTHFIENGFAQLFVASVQGGALLESPGCVSECVVELMHAFCLTQAGKAAVLDKDLLKHLFDALVHPQHLLPLASNPLQASTAQSIGRSLLALCADVGEAVEELGRTTKSHLHAAIQDFVSTEIDHASADLSMSPPRMLHLQQLTNILVVVEGVLSKQHRFQVDVVDGVLDEELLRLLVNCYQFTFQPGQQLFAQLAAQSNMNVTHYGFFPTAKYVTGVLKAVIQASPSKLVPILFDALETQLAELADAKAALMATVTPTAAAAAAISGLDAEDEAALSPASKRGRRRSRATRFGGAAQERTPDVMMDGVLSLVRDDCPFQAPSSATAGAREEEKPATPIEPLHRLTVSIATIEWLTRLLGPALRPAQYAPGQANKVLESAKDTLRRLFAFHRSSLQELLKYSAEEVDSHVHKPFTTASNPGWPVAALAHLDASSVRLPADVTQSRTPTEFVVRIVHPAGAYVREHPAIDGSRIVLVAPFGAVLTAYERQVNDAGIMRYRTAYGWLSEYRREPKREPIVEVLAMKFADTPTAPAAEEATAGGPYRHVLTCRESFRCLLSRLLEPIGQIVVSLSRAVVVRRQHAHFHLPRAHGEDVRLADSAENVASSLGKIVSAYINDALPQEAEEGGVKRTAASDDTKDAATVLYTHTVFNLTLSALLDDRRLRVNTYVMKGLVQHGSLDKFLKAAETVCYGALSAVEHAASQQTTFEEASLSRFQRSSLCALPNLLTHLQHLAQLDGYTKSPVTQAMKEARSGLGQMTADDTIRSIVIAVGEKFLRIFKHPSIGLLPPQALKGLLLLWTTLATSLRDAPREAPRRRPSQPGARAGLVLRTPAQSRAPRSQSPPPRPERPLFRPDPAVLELVESMGFSRDAAHAASLALSSNDPNAIMEYLLTQPAGQQATSAGAAAAPDTSEEDELMRAIALSMLGVDASAAEESAPESTSGAAEGEATSREQAEQKEEESLEENKQSERDGGENEAADEDDDEDEGEEGENDEGENEEDEDEEDEEDEDEDEEETKDAGTGSSTAVLDRLSNALKSAIMDAVFAIAQSCGAQRRLYKNGTQSGAILQRFLIQASHGDSDQAELVAGWLRQLAERMMQVVRSGELSNSYGLLHLALVLPAALQSSSDPPRPIFSWLQQAEAEEAEESTSSGAVSELLRAFCNEAHWQDWLEPAALLLSQFCERRQADVEPALSAEQDAPLELDQLHQALASTSVEPALPVEERQRLVGHIAQLLQTEPVGDSSAVHAVLQLLASALTDPHTHAAFQQHAGLVLLLKLNKTARFAGARQLASSIARQLVEDESTLTDSITQAVAMILRAAKAAAGRPGQRQGRNASAMTLRTFLAKTSHMYAKSPAAFLEAIKQCCEFRTSGDDVFVHYSRKSHQHSATRGTQADLLAAHPTWSLISDLLEFALDVDRPNDSFLSRADALHVLADIAAAAPGTREFIQEHEFCSSASVINRLIELILDRCHSVPGEDPEQIQRVETSQAAVRLLSVLSGGRFSAREAICSALVDKLKQLAAVAAISTDVDLLKVKTLCFLVHHLCIGYNPSNVTAVGDSPHRTRLDLVQSLLTLGAVDAATTALGAIDLDHQLAPETVRAALELLEFVSRPSVIRNLKKRREAMKATRGGRAHTLEDDEPYFHHDEHVVRFNVGDTGLSHGDVNPQEMHAEVGEHDGDDEEENGQEGRVEEVEEEVGEGEEDEEEDEEDEEESDEEDVRARLENMQPRLLGARQQVEEDEDEVSGEEEEEDEEDEEDAMHAVLHDMIGEELDEEDISLEMEDIRRRLQRAQQGGWEAVEDIGPRLTDVMRRWTGDLSQRLRLPEDFVTPPNQVRTDPLRAWMTNTGGYDPEGLVGSPPDVLQMMPQNIFGGAQTRVHYERDGSLVFEISPEPATRGPRERPSSRLTNRRSLLPPGSSGRNVGSIEPPAPHPLLASIARRAADRSAARPPGQDDSFAGLNLRHPAIYSTYAGRRPDAYRAPQAYPTLAPQLPPRDTPVQERVGPSTAVPRLSSLLQRYIIQDFSIAAEPEEEQQQAESGETREETKQDSASAEVAPAASAAAVSTSPAAASAASATAEQAAEQVSPVAATDDMSAGTREVVDNDTASLTSADAHTEERAESQQSEPAAQAAAGGAGGDGDDDDGASSSSSETESQGDADEPEQQPAEGEGQGEAAAAGEGEAGGEGGPEPTEEAGLVCPPDYDPEVFAALPEFMQREIVEQYQQTRDQNMELALAAGLDPDALAALPEAIRQEVLEQARREQQAQAAQEAPADPSHAEEMDNASFLASLTPELRAEVLMQSDPAFLASLPPDMIAEAQLLRERVASRYQEQGYVFNGRRRGEEAVEVAQPPPEPQPTPEELHPGQMQVEVDDPQLNVLPPRFLAVGASLLYQRRSDWGFHSLERCFLNLVRDPALRTALFRTLLALLEPNQQDAAAQVLLQLCRREDLPDQFPPHRLFGPRSTQAVRKVDDELASPHDATTPNEAVRATLNVLSHLLSNSGRYKHSALLPVDDSSVSFFERLISLLKHARFSSASDIVDDLMRLLDTVSSPLDSIPAQQQPAAQGEQKAASEAEAETKEESKGAEETPQQRGAAAGGATSEADTVWVDIPRPQLQEATLYLLCGVLLLDACTEESFRRVSRIITRVAYSPQHVSAITARLRQVVEELSETISSKLLDSAKKASALSAGVAAAAATADATAASPAAQAASNLAILPLPAQQLARFNRTLQMLVSLTEKTNGRAADTLAMLNVQDLWDALDVLMDTLRTSSGLEDEDTSSTTAAAANAPVVRAGPSSSAVTTLLLRLLPLIESFCALMGRLATLVQERNAPPNAEQLPEESTIPFTRVDSLPGARFRRVTSYRSSVHDADEAADNEYLLRLISFAQAHHTLLNALIQAKPSLLEQSLKPLIDTPQCRVQLSFDNKRAYFRSQLHKMKDQRYMRRTMYLSVRRSRIFEDSFHQLRMRRDEEMLQRLSVTFHGEEGIDAGGLTREWFTVLAREIFNPNYALFTAANDGATFQPNPLSYVNPDHLDYFRFVGRVIGKAIVDEQLMDAHFTVSFYKHLLGLPITHHDMEAVDPEYYKNLKQILEYPLDDLGLDLTFSAEDSRFGKLEIIDLIPDGRNKRVTDENKLEYVNLITCHRMTTAIRAQIEAFLEGFHGLVPAELISVFSPAELELLICGLPDVDVEDLRANTEYQHFQPTDDQIVWFWDTLRSFSREDKAQFLQFVTGTSKVPLDGFANLRGVRGPQRFSIHRMYDTNLLPTAHTCFNQLDLPAYESQEILREKLLIAIREGHSGFGFA